jgi:flagellar biosynthesis/type III secretory pathway protein FliH
MRDILQDTWAYKKIKKEGLEEGRREGRQQGLQEGLQQGLQEGRQQGLQEGLQEGLQQGLQEGLQQGLQQGRQQALHEALQEQRMALLEIVRGRFPAIEQQAKRTVDTITDLALLRTMIVKLSLAQTEEAAKQILLEKGMAKS